ncbi:LLM class F420-dependent oxidoreductase [Microbacterium sp. NPDC055910]|uniref:LLM class F420-dependent oxidoreductase n=1 Tax=Microbacterium sp. NPDC055910 TaxID=3345659 RepID=UPI0035DDA18B
MSDESMKFGEIGVWRASRGLDPDLARGIERLGYAALWVGGSPAGDLHDVEAVVAATERIVVATGVVNIWHADATEVAASYHRIEENHPGRFVLGIGSGHREADAARTRPLAAMRDYLDVLDAEGVPADRRLLAALGPKTLQLSAERSLGAHPYLTTPAHTRFAREALGPDAFLAPEQMFIATDDPEAARKIARGTLRSYLKMSNYADMLVKFDFDRAQLEGEADDAVIDALTPWGAPETIASAVRAHLDAGADHVCIQSLPMREDPLGALETMADALGITPG